MHFTSLKCSELLAKNVFVRPSTVPFLDFSRTCIILHRHLKLNMYILIYVIAFALCCWILLFIQMRNHAACSCSIYYHNVTLFYSIPFQRYVHCIYKFVFLIFASCFTRHFNLVRQMIIQCIDIATVLYCMAIIKIRIL